MSGVFFIGLVCVVALLGPVLRPDPAVHANSQNLSLALLKPGTGVRVLRVAETTGGNASLSGWLHGGWPRGYTEVPVKEVTLQGDSLLAEVYVQWGGSTQLRIFELKTLKSISEAKREVDRYVFSRTFHLGTDKYGRDFMSRLMAGSIISIAVGFIAVIISLIIGLLIGVLAGYYRGWVDHVLMWFTNVVWAIPTLLLVMAITFAFGTGFWKVFLAVGLTMWVEVARMARGQVLSLREREYVEAARVLGFSDWRIMFRHILPNMMGPIIVICAANFASAILIEAGLSFLGLGAQIPAPSWGNIIREHYAFVSTGLAYLALAPGVLIMLLVLSFMLVGNGLRDAFDVRQ